MLRDLLHHRLSPSAARLSISTSWRWALSIAARCIHYLKGFFRVGHCETLLESAVYDFESRMLRGFLDGLSAHLTPGGQGWLILSDIAEHLALRTRDDLLAMIDKAGSKVVGKINIKPRHRRVFDAANPLHSARAAEVTSLRRLGVRA
jgi:hypothetical protein